MNEPTGHERIAQITSELDRVRDTLIQHLRCEDLPFNIDPRASMRRRLDDVLERSRHVLKRELGMTDPECDLVLVQAVGGSGNRCAKRLDDALSSGGTIADIVDTVVKQRRRRSTAWYTYTFRGQVFASEAALYAYFSDASRAQTPADHHLSASRLSSRLKPLQREYASNPPTGPIPIDEEFFQRLAPLPKCGSANARRQPIHLIDDAGCTLGSYPNGQRLWDERFAVLGTASSEISARQFNRNLKTYLRRRQVDVKGEVTLTLSDLTDLLMRKPTALAPAEIVQRIDAYERQHHVALTISRDDACDSYESNRTKLPWRCLKHPSHAVYEKPFDKLHQGCPVCGEANAINKRRQTEYEKHKRYIEETIGVQLATPCGEYINSRLPLRLIDHLGVTHMRSMNSLRRCPLLRSKSASEHVTRMILEESTGLIFWNARPSFLRGLELDNYCEERGLSVECDGIQHYRFTPKYHRVEADLYAQQERDRVKDQLCLEHGVHNVRLPYTLFSFANPDARRPFHAPSTIMRVYEALCAKDLGIPLRPKAEVVEALSDRLVAAINLRQGALTK
ncbi:hypothetical protein [Thiocapsa roseopersicina]|uniref:Uncharacterized protein n=1 Tax=Thiocapsa roseopersicina TaxID=1058 RepID=A0A1H3CJV4_THIRO|nr:hypothetical protein [Thiocapsa roseopersicina]SDX54542.1 hypothetical protein SAMN05421783_13511 [Thiocapsa roseopersicina]